MKFLVDNQLPTALARFLATRGLDCQHVLDIGLASASDAEIWEYAGSNHMIVISKDEDFFYLSGTSGSTAQLSSSGFDSATVESRRY